MAIESRRIAWIGSLIAAVALFGVGALPGMPATIGGQVDIIEWVNPPAVNATKAVDAAFQQALHIKVNLTTAVNRTTNYAALERTSVQSGSQDIMAVKPIQPVPPGMPTSDLSPEQLWGVDGVYLALDNEPWVKNLLPASRDVQTYKGHLYGLNTGVYQIGVFYNKATFARYHLTPPKTLDEFFTLAATLKRNGQTPLWFGTGAGAAVYEWIMLMDSQLMAVYGNTNVNDAFWAGKAKFTDARFLQALTQAKKITSVMEPNWQGEDWTQMPGAFASGKATMLLDGSWDMASVMTANAQMRIGYFPLPGSNDASRNVSILQPDLTWVVLKNARNRENALRWLDNSSKPAVYAQYVKITGISPSFSGTYPSATQQILGPYLSKGLLEANAEPSLPSAVPFALQPNNFYNTLQQVLTGQVSPQKAVQEWQAAWDSMHLSMHK